MVRIFLVVTVLALLGGGFIAMNNGQGRIDNLSTDLANTQNTLSDTERDLGKAEKAQELAETARDAAQVQAEDAKARLSKAVSDLVQQRDRANEHENNANKLRPTIWLLCVNLASWTSLPIAIC